MPLKQLLAKYPLPAEWSAPELFSEQVRIGGYRTNSCGILVTHKKKGTEVVASAAEPSLANALARAYFELLERVVIMEACEKKSFADQFPTGSILSAYSKSNGIALHSRPALARRSALLELVERDCVLRSWYGEISPRPLKLSLSQQERALDEFYELQAFELNGPVDAYNAAIFLGLPRDPGAHPLFFGFGAGVDTASALRKAQSEASQRLAFLWGEKISRRLPAFSPTPGYHQEVYLVPRNKSKLVNWLEGKHFQEKPVFRIAPAEKREEFGFVNLTPDWLAGRLHVYKAQSETRVPLWFGQPMDALLRAPRAAIAIHPIA